MKLLRKISVILLFVPQTSFGVDYAMQCLWRGFLNTAGSEHGQKLDGRRLQAIVERAESQQNPKRDAWVRFPILVNDSDLGYARPFILREYESSLSISNKEHHRISNFIKTQLQVDHSHKGRPKFILGHIDLYDRIIFITGRPKKNLIKTALNRQLKDILGTVSGGCLVIGGSIFINACSIWTGFAMVAKYQRSSRNLSQFLVRSLKDIPELEGTVYVREFTESGGMFVWYEGGRFIRSLSKSYGEVDHPKKIDALARLFEDLISLGIYPKNFSPEKLRYYNGFFYLKNLEEIVQPDVIEDTGRETLAYIQNLNEGDRVIPGVLSIDKSKMVRTLLKRDLTEKPEEWGELIEIPRIRKALGL